MADWSTVREIATGLPGVQESTTYGQPALVRLQHVDRDRLAERIEESWLLRAPKRLAAELDADD